MKYVLPEEVEIKLDGFGIEGSIEGQHYEMCLPEHHCDCLTLYARFKEFFALELSNAYEAGQASEEGYNDM